MLYAVVWVITLAFSGALYLQGQLSIGTMVLLVAYITLMETPIKYIRRQAGNFAKKQSPASAASTSFCCSKPDVQEQVTAVLPDNAASVQFENVSFAYKDDLGTNGKVKKEDIASNESQIAGDDHASRITHHVLEEISFNPQPNKILGLLGRTGSGKTTLTRLLFRLYDVDEGVVSLGGIDVRHVGLSDLRQHIGMVTQDVQLFEATIRDNLTLFRNYDPDTKTVSDEQIIEAIKTLGLEDWFNELPDGLDTMLKSGGQGLSAGEAQLLAFTRVFLRDPHLIILDEASSTPLIRRRSSSWNAPSTGCFTAVLQSSSPTV